MDSKGSKSKNDIFNKLYAMTTTTTTATYNLFIIYLSLSFLAYNSLLSADLNLILKGLKQLCVM